MNQWRSGVFIPGDDNLKIEYPRRVFERNRVSNCYKYFCFFSYTRKDLPEIGHFPMMI